MGYPQNYRTIITLPIGFEENITLNQYKEKYGVDLSEYIELNTQYKRIEFNPHGKIFYIRDTYSASAYIHRNTVLLLSEISYESQDSGNEQDAVLALMGSLNNDFKTGIMLSIPYDQDIKKENVLISNYNV